MSRIGQRDLEVAINEAEQKGIEKLARNKKALERGREFGQAVVAFYDLLSSFGSLELGISDEGIGIDSNDDFVLVPSSPIEIFRKDSTYCSRRNDGLGTIETLL